jgi:predicted acyl esterase
VGGNFAVLDDAYNWLEWQFGMRGPLRAAPVATAQAWDGNKFRLENYWPVPGTTTHSWFLSRTASDKAANGSLVTGGATGAQAGDVLANLPTAPSGASSTPYADQVKVNTGARGVPYADLRYLSAPVTKAIEVAGLPTVKFWVKSTNTKGHGQAQLHVALYTVTPDGTVTEFARTHRGYRGLGTAPKLVSFPLTVSSVRLAPGSRLMLQITPNDLGESVMFKSADRTTVLHDSAHPSAIQLPLAPVDRKQPPGALPSGPAFPADATGAICKGLGLPC